MSLIILGLDGLNLPLFEYSKKSIPNLNSLLQKSAYGHIKSVFPPLSGPAWTTILTGKGIGAHSFLNSFYYDSQLKLKLFRPESVTDEHFYETIFKSGGKIFLMDVPFSSTRTISGDFLDSYFSSRPKEDLITPKSLLKKFPSIAKYINYKEKNRNIIEYIRSFSKILQSNGRIIKDVISSKEYDLMFFQLTFTDWLQHKAFLDLKYNQNSKKAKAALDVLEELDNLIGWILENKKEEDHLIILSDHGLGELKGTFFINSFLKEHGYLKIKNSQGVEKNYSFKKNIFRKLTALAKSSRFLLKLAKPIHRRFFGKDDKMQESIDYQKSSACALIKNIPIIKILEENQQKKEELKKELIKLFKEKLNFNAYDTTEFYSCTSREVKEKLSLFGDITVKISEWEVDISLSRKIFLGGKVIFHTPNAVFIANGNGIRTGEFDGGELQDIARTLLSFYNIAIPQEYQGKALPIFEKDFEKHKIILKNKKNCPEKIQTITDEIIEEIDF